MRRQTLGRFVVVTSVVLALIVAFTTLISPNDGKPTPVQAASERRPLRYDIIDMDATWGPGVITITSDVVVKNGATLTVLPRTTVLMGTNQVPTDTTPYPGGASDKIEIIVEADGRLVADGFYTDTQLSDPTPSITFTSGTWEENWGGIRILGAGCGGSGGGNESVIRFATIEWAIGGIYVEGSSPSLSYNVIHQIWGQWGENGASGADGDNGIDGTASDPNGRDAGNGGEGGDGTDGELGYGIMISGTGCTPWVAYNALYDIYGGGGGKGGGGGEGGRGGHGWSHLGLPGPGYGGGRGGQGGAGGHGGAGGDAVALYVHGASPTILANAIENVRGGDGGGGGNGGYGGNGGNGSNGEADPGISTAAGGAGNDAGDGGPGGSPGPSGDGWGIYVEGGSPEVRGNVVRSIVSYGSDGGRGGDGGTGGLGGDAGGYSSGGCHSAAPGLAGDGGQGGDGGAGGASGLIAGIYVTNTDALVIDNTILDVEGSQGGKGGNPGRGGDGGAGGGGTNGAPGGGGGDSGRGGRGGDGGLSAGIYANANADVRRNTIFNIRGGHGERGGSLSYRGGNGGEGGDSYCNGNGGNGGNGGKGFNNGNGGEGGPSAGIFAESADLVENNVIYDVYGGNGGWGGNENHPEAGLGGDGGTGGLGHNGGADGSSGWGGDGGDAGAGGDAGLGMGVQSGGAPRIANNTVDRLHAGDGGEAGTPGAGGTGSVPGASGATAPAGASGSALGLHLSQGATGDVYNNIVVRSAYTTTHGSFVITSDSSVGISGTTGSTLDYNDVWGWGNNYMGVSAGPHDISAAPLFVDVSCPGCEDFSLAKGSPCIDAGTNAQAPLDDRNNVLRPQDGDLDGHAIVDMGAYELLAGNTFTLTCDAGGVFTTTDEMLTVE